MKENWASSYLEAHLNMQDDTDSVKNDCSVDDGIRVPLNGNFFLNDDCVRIHEQQQNQKQPQSQSLQQPTMSTMSILKIFQILCISIVYLLFTTNTVVFANAIDSTEIGGSVSNGNEFFRLMALASDDASSAIDFDPANRGSKKFGDKCESTQECSFAGSICDPKKYKCQCIDDLPITNHLDKCGKKASVNESCFFNEECESVNERTECRDGRCACRYELTAVVNSDGNIECKALQESREPERYVDPAMIGILAGMALMFIIICVVLRLFSRARWRETRTIFNTPNPRLMNVSLLRDNKLMHSQERRGSRMSMRMPSRQPSMASLRPHSPNPSIGRQGSRRGSRKNSNTSAASTRSNRSSSTGHSINKVITAIIPINMSPTSNDKHLGDMTDI